MMDGVTAAAFYSRDKARAALMKELEELNKHGTAERNLSGRNLVMGLAANYSHREVAAFVLSLRNSGYTDDIALFVTTLDNETKSFFELHKVTAIPAWQTLFSYLNIQFARHVAYFDYLSSLIRNKIIYDRIFLTDVRDVIFQAEPFQAIPDDPITFFLENNAVTIGTCESNSHWIATGFGLKELERLADKPISCCGTVIGNWRTIMEYLLWMLIFSTLLKDDAFSTYGTDSSCHNMLVYSGLLARQRISSNGDGVLTLHHVAGRETVYVNADGFVVDKRGKIFPVVHQYDRLDELADHIINRRALLAL